MLIRLLRERLLQPYGRLLLGVLVLQLVGTLASLYLPSLNAAIIDRGVLTGDTVLGGSRSALRCGLDFFGVDHVVFASDCPFDPEGGPMFIREGIGAIEDMDLSDEDREKLYLGNALKLMRMSRIGKA